MDAQLKALPTLPVRARTVSGCVNSANLNISQHFTVHLFSPWIPSSACGKGGGPRRFTAIVLNVSRRRFGGPAGVEPQSPGEPGPRRGGPLIASPSRSNLSAPWPRSANAGYQPNGVAQGSASRSGLTLLSLPPDSPNLNLIERLWKFVKRRAFCGRYQPTFAQFQAAIQEVLDGLSITHTEKLKSLMTLKFQRFEDVSLMAA